MKTILAPLTVTALIFALSGCGEDAPSDASQSTSPQLEGLFVDAEPTEALSVIEARKTVTPGSDITVTGRVAGAMKPFTEEYALLVLADDTLETCERIPGDECPTPWDACCADPEVIKNSRLTLQVVGEDARPLGLGLKGVNGLKELDGLVVSGTIAEGSTAENLIVNATSIYHKPFVAAATPAE